jgi:predicted Kef-type K+ transport protein
MPLTLNEALFLILTVAAMVAVIFLVRLFVQLRRTAAEGEKALADIAELARQLKELDLLVKQRLEEAGQTLAAAKTAATSLAEVSFLVTSKFVRPSAKYLPLILPVAQFLWRQIGKRKKERAHGKRQ